jgi:hypothetical protein
MGHGAYFDGFLAMFGGVVAGCGLFSWERTRRFLKGAMETDGTVVAMVRLSDSDGVTYAPVVGFIDQDGEYWKSNPGVGSSPAGFKVGDRVRVLYERSNPRAARIHSFFQVWGLALILLVVGVGFVAFGVVALLADS